MSAAEDFCRNYVQDLFERYDTDVSNVLNRKELNRWLKYEMKLRPLQRNLAQGEFRQMLVDVDTNGDGLIDRW